MASDLRGFTRSSSRDKKKNKERFLRVDPRNPWSNLALSVAESSRRKTPQIIAGSLPQNHIRHDLRRNRRQQNPVAKMPGSEKYPFSSDSPRIGKSSGVPGRSPAQSS